eukprot:5285267-Pyramimonas_sp.AAC.1
MSSIHNLSDFLGDEPRVSAFNLGAIDSSQALILKQFAQRIQNGRLTSQVDVVFSSQSCVGALVKHRG